VARFCAFFLYCLLLAVLPVTAQAPGTAEAYAQIRAEETNNSKIMWIIHEVADVYGPRVTGSPNLKAADDWAVKTMASWGLVNTHLEPWTFQPPSAATPVPGWESMELVAEAVAPFHGQLMVKPLAWTPSTKGLVVARSAGVGATARRRVQLLRNRATSAGAEVGSPAAAACGEI